MRGVTRQSLHSNFSRMENGPMHRILLTLIAGLLLASEASAGPISDYYVVDGDGQRMVVIHGNSIVNSWTMTDNQYPIAVTTTVKAYATYSNNTGAEYTLTGTPTGTTYPFQGD